MVNQSLPSVQVPYMYDSLSRELSVMCVGCDKTTIRELCSLLPMSQILTTFNREQQIDQGQLVQAQQLIQQSDNAEEQAALLASVVPPEVS